MSSFSSIPLPVSFTYTQTALCSMSILHPNVIEPFWVNLLALLKKLEITWVKRMRSMLAGKKSELSNSRLNFKEG